MCSGCEYKTSHGRGADLRNRRRRDLSSWLIRHLNLAESDALSSINWWTVGNGKALAPAARLCAVFDA